MNPKLSQRDLKRLSDRLIGLYAARGFDDFLKEVFESTGLLIATDSQNYNDVLCEVRPRRKSTEWQVNEIEARHYEVVGTGRRLEYFVAASPMRTDLDPAMLCSGFERHVMSHPILVHNRRRQSLESYRLSDLVADRLFTEQAIYTEFFRYFPVRRQIISYLEVTPRRQVVCALSRGPGKDFTDRDVALMRVFGPHLRQAWLKVQATAEQRRHHAEWSAILDRHRLSYARLTTQLQISWMTTEAERCLRNYFPRQRSPRAVPDAVELWLRRHPFFAPREDLLERSSALPWVVHRDGSRLVLDVERMEDGGVLLVLKEEKTVLSAEGFSYSGLTQAESRVLFWVTQGRTNAAIATLLDISGRTVNKHIQNIFMKMGVANRAEAIVAARQAHSD